MAVFEGIKQITFGGNTYKLAGGSDSGASGGLTPDYDSLTPDEVYAAAYPAKILINDDYESRVSSTLSISESIYWYSGSSIVSPGYNTSYRYTIRKIIGIGSIRSTAYTSIGSSTNGYIYNGLGGLNEIELSECVTIGNATFSNCQALSRVSFPKCRVIESSAFCSATGLDSVTFPECREIGSYAFLACYAGSAGAPYDGLSYVDFPMCISAGEQAFGRCFNLIEANFQNLPEIPPRMFRSCTRLSSVRLDNCIIVNQSAFFDCVALSSLYLPKCIELRSYALSGIAYQLYEEGLDSIVPNCKVIHENAIPNIARTQAVWSGTNLSNGSTYFSGIRSVTMTNCERIGSAAFISHSSLYSVSFPACKRVDPFAFANCSSLYSVYLPNCELIGEGAFDHCVTLNSIQLSKCKSIPGGAFFLCTGLQNAEFNSCTIIGTYAFSGCTALSTIVIPNVSYIGSWAFSGCSAMASAFSQWTFPALTVLCGDALPSCSLSKILPSMFPVLSEMHGVSGWCSSTLTLVSLPTLTSAYYTFYYCKSLTTVSLPSLQWASYAFYNCSGISRISFPNLIYAGDHTFAGCSSLTTVDLPNLSYIGRYAFASCSSLRSVSVPNVSFIGESAFRYCTSLEQITLPNVLTMGDGCFDGCTKLLSVYLPGSTIPSVTWALFAGNAPPSSAKVYVPASMLSGYKAASGWGYWSSRIYSYNF